MTGRRPAKRPGCLVATLARSCLLAPLWACWLPPRRSELRESSLLRVCCELLRAKNCEKTYLGFDMTQMRDALLVPRVLVLLDTFSLRGSET